MKTNHLMIVALSLLLMQLAGCSSGTVPLSGKVVFSDDGAPVPIGTVCFSDGKSASRGTIKEDGTFVMGFVRMEDGIPPGRYTVYFIGVELPDPAKDQASMDNTSPLIDRKYTKPDTSGLEVEITAATKTMEFKLDRFKSGR